MKPPPFKILSRRTLARCPIPDPAKTADKDSRGRVLIVGGSRETAGAVLLSAIAALRAGAGKLSVAVPMSLALPLALRLPEARVIALPESRTGNFNSKADKPLSDLVGVVDALLMGPGMAQERATASFSSALLARFDGVPTVVDAGALPMLVHHSPRPEQSLVITPHAGEMARLMRLSKESVQTAPQQTALNAAERWHVTVVLKGHTTWVVNGSLGCLKFVGAEPGLATSGSGDVLAGIIAGLLARGLSPGPASSWAVLAHHSAGKRLSSRHGAVGYLASEMLVEIPSALARLSH